MNPSNRIGELNWYIVTAADQVNIPDFVFDPFDAPYMMAQASDGRIFVLERAAMAELVTMWRRADKALEDTE